MIEIRYSNGSEAMVDTLAEAMVHVQSTYPEAVFYTQDGCELVLPDAADEAALASEDARILAWPTEAASVNDDGARAIASLRGA